MFSEFNWTETMMASPILLVLGGCSDRQDASPGTLDLERLRGQTELFLGELDGMSDPEQKRKTIGRLFIDVDGSGDYTAGDTPLPGVDVVISDTNAVTYTVTTDADGRVTGFVERHDETCVGGLARTAFGGMALVGTSLQRAMRIKDTPELALADWHSFAEFGADEQQRVADLPVGGVALDGDRQVAALDRRETGFDLGIRHGLGAARGRGPSTNAGPPPSRRRPATRRCFPSIYCTASCATRSRPTSVRRSPSVGGSTR